MRFILAFPLFLTLLISKVYGQERYQPTKVIPASPTAASLGVYGDVNVGYYTGAPNIEIPLYDIKTNHHAQSIKLQYSASGIRVSQEASWVGLGWSLSAGGVITRTIRGVDDLSTEGYNNTDNLPPSDINNNYSADNNNDWNYFRNIRDNSKDGEPDVFFYNFGNYSGKFVIGKKVNGEPILMADRNNLEIKFDINFSTEYSLGYATGQWIVKTPDGYQYYFRTPEMSRDYYNQNEYTDNELLNLRGLEPNFTNSYREAVTSWYLDMIVSPSGEQVKFIYEAGLSLSLISRNQTRYDLVEVLTLDSEAPLSSYYNYFNTSRQVNYDIYLKRIEFTNGYIVFNRANRGDIEPYPFSSIKPAKLSDIEVYNSSNTLLKRFVLQHSYFNDFSTSNDYAYKRLKLDAVTEYGKNGVAKPAYTFDYYDSNNLPNKYSKQVDNWGFNTSFYSPTLTGERSPTMLPAVQASSTKYFDGARRNPDETGNYIKKGILTSITYPTGGSTKFDYEVHDYSNLSGTDAFMLIQHTAYAYADPDMQEYQLTASFDLPEQTAVKFTPTAYVITGDETLDPIQNLAYLRNGSNTLIHSFNQANGESILTLPAGHYTLQVDEIANYYTRIFASYDVKESVRSKKGGGFRIRTITNFDVNGIKLTAKRFIYTQDGTISGLSSGRLLSKPFNYYTNEVRIITANDLEGSNNPPGEYYSISEGGYLVRTSSTIFPPGFSSQGNIIGYDKVTVLKGENGEGGKTEYSYFNKEDIVDPSGFPGLPSQSDSKNGKLDYVLVKDQSGKSIKKTTYVYNNSETFHIEGIKLFKPMPENYPQSLYEQLGYFNFDIKYYDVFSTWWTLLYETEEHYSNNGVLKVIKQYNYANPNHKQITSQKDTRSDGTEISTNYKYPHDFTAQAVYNDMVNNRHIISPIIEQTTLKNSTTFLETIKTNYSNSWGNNIPAIETIETITLDITDPPVIRLRYHSYDNKGNMASVSKEGDAKTSYIWGYNKSLPVVKAENVTISTLTAKVSEVLSEMGYVNGINDMDNFLTTLGSLAQSVQKTSWKTFNQKLLDKFSSSKVLINTYTYVPLIGITSMTDANKIAIYYEYDNFGRMQIVRDDKGNIIKSYKYNYKQ